MGFMERWDNAPGEFELENDVLLFDMEMDSMPEPTPGPRPPPTLRKDFPETWLWEYLESLDNSSGLVHAKGSGFLMLSLIDMTGCLD